MKLIAFNDTDNFGSQGVWIEAAEHAGISAQEAEIIKDCGFEDTDDLDLTIVDLAKISEEDDADFSRIASQWGMSYDEGHTSEDTDSIIRAEYARRLAADEDFSVDGHAANRHLEG